VTVKSSRWVVAGIALGAAAIAVHYFGVAKDVVARRSAIEIERRRGEQVLLEAECRFDEAALRNNARIVRISVDLLQHFERLGALTSRVTSSDVAGQLAEELRPREGEQGFADDDATDSARVDDRGRVLWRREQVSVHRFGAAQMNDTGWSGDLLILLVGNRPDGRVRSGVALLDAQDSVWIIDGAADIEAVLASSRTHSIAESLSGLGWRVLPSSAELFARGRAVLERLTTETGAYGR